MKTTCLLIIVLIFCQSLKAQTVDSNYTLSTPVGEVIGTLTIAQDAKEDLVIIVPGSGPTDRNGNNPMGLQTNTYKMLSDSLYNYNIGSLRYDKKGIGESVKVAEENLIFEDYVEDLILWIKKLKKETKAKKIYLLGHSEGALIAMLAAVREPVEGVISVAGTALPADTLLLQQLNKQPGLYTKAKPVIEKLSRGDTAQNVPPMLISVFRPSVQPYLISWFKFDPVAVIKDLKIPILIIHGSKDIQIPQSQAKLLSKAGGSNAQLEIIENMNHVLKTVVEDDVTANMQTYSDPNKPLNHAMVKKIINFIQSK